MSPDKLFYIALVSVIVFYMLWNHGNVEFMEEENTVVAEDTESDAGDESGEMEAIKEGQKEMETSDTDADLTPAQAKIAIHNYLKVNSDSLSDDPFSFLALFQKLTDDEDKTKTAMDFVGNNDAANLKKFISNI